MPVRYVHQLIGNLMKKRPTGSEPDDLDTMFIRTITIAGVLMAAMVICFVVYDYYNGYH